MAAQGHKGWNKDATQLTRIELEFDSLDLAKTDLHSCWSAKPPVQSQSLREVKRFKKVTSKFKQVKHIDNAIAIRVELRIEIVASFSFKEGSSER